MSLNLLERTLKKCKDPEYAKRVKTFFKTKPGEYSYGDKFWGVKVPMLRQIATQFSNLSLDDIEPLLCSPIHEKRLLALIMLINLYNEHPNYQTDVVAFYQKHRQWVNNWDLVDLSAPRILGPHYYSQKRDDLFKLVLSENLWDRRIAILTTFYFIKQHDYNDTLALAEMLLNDPHDLMHKAVGWMIREIGKCSLLPAEEFIRKHRHQMPRTMLRYALERFPKEKRQWYMRK